MLIVLILSVSGCATSPSQQPDWELAAIPPAEVTDPVDIPLLCEVGEWPAECWLALERYEIVAEGNWAIAQANADALRNTEAAYEQLIQAGVMQTQLMEFYMNELEKEQQGRFIDGLFYKTLIAIGLVVLP